MRLGIIGLPQSGKTTIFNALTRGTSPSPLLPGGWKFIPRWWMFRMSGWISFGIFKPRKTIYAKVTYADVAGLEGGTKTEIAGTLLNQLSQMDGFIHVVRCFTDENVPHPQGSVNPVRDLRSMDEEFILNDQIKVEKKLASLKEEKQKGAGRDKAVIEHETILFEKLLNVLQHEKTYARCSLD